jgi:hypothetical protein
MKALSVVLLGFLLTISVSNANAQKRVGGKMLKGYDVIYPFKNGKAKVIKAGKVGYIDPTGEEIIKPRAGVRDPCVMTVIFNVWTDAKQHRGK